MSRQIAVVGDGVSAGLAVYLLSDKYCVTLIKSGNQKKSNPIPEFVPRRAFFDALKVSDKIENEIINESFPKVKNVILSYQGECITRNLDEQDEYFFYDKSRLSSWLINSSDVEVDSSREIRSIKDVEQFDLILDCRGSNAVLNDACYCKKNEYSSLTQCAYLISERDESIIGDQMMFWVKNGRKAHDNITLFAIPVGEGEVSFGCSSSAENRYSHKEVLNLFLELGINIDKELIKFSGEARPNRIRFGTAMSRVKPIGEAFESSCPLTEFGVMKALQQIVEIEMSEKYSMLSRRQWFEGQFDPHIPMELFK